MVIDAEENGEVEATSEDVFAPARVVRPREQVEGQIRDAIFSGRLAQGDKLPSEAELAKRFSVSRPTIREALRSLASAGLLAKTPGATGGSFVRHFNHEALGTSFRESVSSALRLKIVDTDELYAVRVILEGPSAALAALNRTEEHLEAMREVIAQQRRTTPRDPEVPHYDETFHGTIASASKNRILEGLVTALHLSIEPVGFLDITEEVAATTIRQHRSILEAIENKDPVAATAAMEIHLEYVASHSKSN